MKACLTKEFSKKLEKMRKKKKEFIKKYKRVKCDCGHYMKDHYNKEGCCNECGCTWYWPNTRYIKRQKMKLKENRVNVE